MNADTVKKCKLTISNGLMTVFSNVRAIYNAASANHTSAPIIRSGKGQGKADDGRAAM